MLGGCASTSSLSASEALSAFDQDAAKNFSGHVLRHFDRNAPNHFCHGKRGVYDCQTFMVVDAASAYVPSCRVTPQGKTGCHPAVVRSGQPLLIAGTVTSHDADFTVNQFVVR